MPVHYNLSDLFIEVFTKKSGGKAQKLYCAAPSRCPHAMGRVGTCRWTAQTYATGVTGAPDSILSVDQPLEGGEKHALPVGFTDLFLSVET